MKSDDGLFSGIEADDGQFRELMEKSGESTLNYGIYFTPRSGSSWLTSVIRGAGVLGNPEEWFNPNFVNRIATGLHARNLDDYIAALRRKKCGKTGVFGYEITYFQMLRVFGERRPWHFFDRDMKSFILIRRDIILQAVSLYKATETNVFHSVSSDEEARKSADSRIEYDAEKIARWTMHILNQELGLLEILDQLPGAPMPLYYEDIIRSPAETVSLVGAHLGVDVSGAKPVSSKHTKIATDKNAEFRERFVSEESEFVEGIVANRDAFLQRMDRLALIEHVMA